MVCRFFLKSALLVLVLALPLVGFADTMAHYMGIVANIPKMEVKADNQAQIWAKSARNILELTAESVAESLLIANQAATEHDRPLFCLPASLSLNSGFLHNLIQQTYRELSSQESDKSTMTVSEVALLGLRKNYPCGAHNPQHKG